MRSIHIFRTGSDTGKMLLAGFSFAACETCWWDPKWVIEARCYQGAPWYMNSKSDGTAGNGLPYKNGATAKTHREAIHFTPAPKWKDGSNTGNGIFLHKGTSPGWSDGCIVTNADLVTKIWMETREFKPGTATGTANLLYKAKMDIYVIDLAAEEKAPQTAAKAPEPEARSLSSYFEGFTV
jgi:hypothetical protein